MRFYGMTDAHVLNMPISRFWMLNASIDRISAQEDFRAARAAMVAQMGESGVKDYFDELSREIGVVVDRDDRHSEPDYEGIQRLKALANKFG